MKEKILNEIYDFCEGCQSHDCCPEDECVLYRIETIVRSKKNISQKAVSKKQKDY